MKQPSTLSVDVPPYYMQMARHWRMGSRSSDSIRQRLIQRGLSSEQALKAIEILDEEHKQAGGWWPKGGYQNRLWVPMRAGGLMMGFAPGTASPHARTWLIGYSGMVLIGTAGLLINQALGPQFGLCMLLGNMFIAIGLVGLVMYVINLLVSRFL